MKFKLKSLSSGAPNISEDSEGVKKMTDAELDRLCLRLSNNDPQLDRLSLYSRSIGNSGVTKLADALQTNHTCTWLDLQKNGITKIGAASLASSLVESSNSLNTLRMWDNSVGDAGAASIAAAVRHNSSITELDLCENSIGRAGATWIASSLRQNSSLTKLWLWKNQCGDEGAGALADALRVNNTLVELYLGFNGIGEPGAVALASALCENRTLRTLWLGGNCISDGGADAFAEALQANSTLKDLFLGMNNISDIGATALASGLKSNKSLQKLELYRNFISDEGACDLSEAISVNASLEELNLCDNNIHDAGAEALATGMSSNANLTLLDVRENPIHDMEVINQIDKSICSNRLSKGREIGEECATGSHCMGEEGYGIEEGEFDAKKKKSVTKSMRQVCKNMMGSKRKASLMKKNGKTGEAGEEASRDCLTLLEEDRELMRGVGVGDRGGMKDRQFNYGPAQEYSFPGDSAYRALSHGHNDC